MVKTAIKIIRGGCGINFTENGRVRHALKTPEDGPFECDIEQAKRLVALGVAEFVSPWTIPEENADQTNTNQDDKDTNKITDPGTDGNNDEPQGDGDEKIVGHLDAEQLEAMTNKQLEELAGELGVDVKGCKKKADFVAAILAVEVETDTDGIVDDLDGDPDNELPDLGAADPE